MLKGVYQRSGEKNNYGRLNEKLNYRMKFMSGADSRLAPRQWETSLQSNTVSHWLGANLESALKYIHKFLEIREMTSWNGNTSRITNPLWGESTGHYGFLTEGQ